MAKLITLEGNKMNRCYRRFNSPRKRRQAYMMGENTDISDFIISGDATDDIIIGDATDSITFGDDIQSMIDQGYTPDGRPGGQFLQRPDGTLGYIDQDGEEWIMDGFGSFFKSVGRGISKGARGIADVGSKVVRSKAFKGVAKKVASGVAMAFGAPPGAGAMAVDQAWKRGDSISSMAHKTAGILARKRRRRRKAQAKARARARAQKRKLLAQRAQAPQIQAPDMQDTIKKFAIPALLVVGGYMLLKKK